MLFDSKNLENWVEISDLTGKIKWIHFHLCFDRKNPANWFEFLLWHVNSKTNIWICVLTKKINLITIYGSLINFSYQICFLTGKIQKIKLNFVFRQVKSNEPKRTNLVSMTFHIYLIFNLILTKIESKLVSYFFTSDNNTLTILCGVLNWHKNCEL